MMNKLIFAVLLFGCQTGTEPPSQTQPDGLTVFTSDRTTGLTGMYRQGDRVVFFETITDPLDEPGDHRADHDQDHSRPMFSSRWTDAEGRTLTMSLSGSSVALAAWVGVDPNADLRRPEEWDALLDLAKTAGVALQAQSVNADVREEQLKLGSMSTEIPAPADRVLAVSEEQLAQIADHQTTLRGKNGYSWFQQFSVFEGGPLPNIPIGAFHQCTAWSNYYYSGGAWHYRDGFYISNGGDCDRQKCGPVSGYVQDYKDSLGQCDGGNQKYYGMCDGTKHRYNCRASALREQTYVIGNRTCSSNSQANGTMCAFEEDLTGGAYCGWHMTCDNVNACNDDR